MKRTKTIPSAASLATTLMTACSMATAGDDQTSGPARVVFVHGIFQSGRMFAPVVRMLEARGCECLVPRLTPADARNGLEPLAGQLKSAIDRRWDDSGKIHIVAHSMGGLISRQYLQHLGGHARCQSLTTLATPHHGTLAAWCYPGKGATQMRRGSAFLTELKNTEHCLRGIALHSYYTPMDLIILPYTSSEWQMAENRIVRAPAHPLVMFAPRVVRHIME
ncbi:MAG TPA: alpha/beta fold hydrolase, partial [Luteolibacter sp.]|nr:alpha/beta fold hydrolase [Luteolibacter sp.]